MKVSEHKMFPQYWYFRFMQMKLCVTMLYAAGRIWVQHCRRVRCVTMNRGWMWSSATSPVTAMTLSSAAGRFTKTTPSSPATWRSCWRYWYDTRGTHTLHVRQSAGCLASDWVVKEEVKALTECAFRIQDAKCLKIKASNIKMWDGNQKEQQTWQNGV